MRVRHPGRAATAFAAGSAAALAAAPNAYASGFALLEQSASRLGTAYAGTAAAADDATTLFYNPAGLAALKERQFVVSLSGVNIGSEFNDGASQPALGQTLGGEGGDAGGWNLVPATYVAIPINDRLAFGAGVNAPFGLKLEYESGWIGRFQALNSEIQTYGIAPALAFRVSPAITLGAAVGYQRVDAELTNDVNYTAVVAQGASQLVLSGQLPPAAVGPLLAANAGLQGTTRLEGDDTTWTYTLGALFEFSTKTRVGISYRSAADYEIEGSVRFARPVAPEPIGAAIIAAAASGPLADGPASVKIKLPEIATASLSQQLSEQVTLMADIAWTGWSSVQELRVVRESGAVLSTTPERWEDTWRYALGVEYAPGGDWTFRAGAAFDETPVPDETRTPRLPDAERTWLAIGARWHPQGALTVDFGYAHLFSDDVSLDQNAGSTAANALLNGQQESAVNIVSLQLGYSF